MKKKEKLNHNILELRHHAIVSEVKIEKLTKCNQYFERGYVRLV